jgi:hypothetical protein
MSKFEDYAKKRGKETGKILIPEDKKPDLSAGRHDLIALQRHKGIVKKKTAKKLEKIAHNRKRIQKEVGIG